MKILGFGILMLVFVVASVEAAFFLEFESEIKEGTLTNFILTPTCDLSKNLQLFAFSSTGESYAEGYGGFAYSPKSWLQIGMGLGLETADTPWRVAASLWAGKGPLSFLWIYENGGSGPWYKATATFTAKEWLTLGLMARRFIGIGPLLQLSLPKTPISIWTTPACYDLKSEQAKALIGISLAM